MKIDVFFRGTLIFIELCKFYVDISRVRIKDRIKKTDWCKNNEMCEMIDCAPFEHINK